MVVKPNLQRLRRRLLRAVAVTSKCFRERHRLLRLRVAQINHSVQAILQLLLLYYLRMAYHQSHA